MGRHFACGFCDPVCNLINADNNDIGRDMFYGGSYYIWRQYRASTTYWHMWYYKYQYGKMEAVFDIFTT